MIRFNKLMMAVVMLFLLSILGCGEFTGPGSNDVEYTGMFLSITNLTPKEHGSATHDVDIYSHICTPATATVPAKYEEMFDETMAITFSYANAPSCAGRTCAALYLKSYTATFASVAPLAIPIDPVSALINGQILPGKSLTLDGLKLLPLYLKVQYLERGGEDNVLFNNNIEIEYEVRVTVKAVTEYGENVEVTSYTYILLADFDYC